MQITKISVMASKKIVANYNSTGMSVGLTASIETGDNVFDVYHQLDQQAKAMVEESLGIDKMRSVLKS